MKKQSPDFREKAAHGDTMLPVSYYCSRIPEDFRHFSLHWHEEAEITYIEKGSANYTINFHSTTVREGDLLLLSPQVLHGAAERDGNTMTSHSLVFHLNFLGCLTPDACTVKYLNPLLTGKYRFIPILSPGQPGYDEIRRLFLEACREFNRKDTAYELRTKARLTELLSELYCIGYIEKNRARHRKPACGGKAKGNTDIYPESLQRTALHTRFGGRLPFQRDLPDEFFPQTHRHHLCGVHQLLPALHGSNRAGRDQPARHGYRTGERIPECFLL